MPWKKAPTELIVAMLRNPRQKNDSVTSQGIPITEAI